MTEWRKILRILRRKWLDDLRHFRICPIQMEIWTSPEDANTIVLPWHFARMVFPVLATMVNAGLLLLIWTVKKEDDFATQVLIVYVCNSSIYTLYYSAMKVCNVL